MTWALKWLTIPTTGNKFKWIKFLPHAFLNIRIKIQPFYFFDFLESWWFIPSGDAGLRVIPVFLSIFRGVLGPWRGRMRYFMLSIGCMLQRLLLLLLLLMFENGAGRR